MKSFSAQEAVDFILAHQLISSSFVEELGGDLSRFQSGEEVINELVRCERLTDYQRSQLLSGQGEKLCFGPYRLVRPLGEGGMGEVFKAWQPRLDRFVALKFIHSEYLHQQSHALVRFQRESHAIAKLQHPNIIVLYDADEIDGVPFIALEFVDGMSLAEMVRRGGPLGVKQACEYMRQTALGLQHAFERGFVHRDIKPSNIVVSQSLKKTTPAPLMKKPSLVTLHDLKRLSDNSISWDLDRIKILDMGVARLNDSLARPRKSPESLTESGAVLGTPDYLAPEQARDSSKVDIRADLYSLGCTFYFILTGQPPFPGGTSLEKMIKHQSDQATPLRMLRRDVPETLARTVEKLLAKKPDDRFQTPLDLAETLSKFLASGSSELELPPIDSEPGPSPLPIEPHEAPGPEPAADSTDFGRSTSEESGIVLPPESVAEFWESLVSRDSVEFGEPDIDELDWELVDEANAIRAAKGKVKPIAKLAAHDAAVSGVAVSWDGRLAVTADIAGQIRVWELTDGKPREVGRKHRRSEVEAIVFAPDDPHCTVFGELRRGKAALVRWDWKSDSLVDWGDFSSLNQKGIGCLSFTSDGSMLAAGVGSLALTWKIANGEATNRTIHKGMDKVIRTIALSPDGQLLAAAGHDTSLHFWDLGIGKWMNTGIRVKSQIATITTMRYSPDGSTLAMAGLDDKIVLWPVAGKAGDSARVLQGHASNVLQVQFIGDGSQLASVGRDGQVIFWDLPTGSIVREFYIDLALAYRVQMSPDGARLIAGFINGTIGIYCPPESF